jgi:hypothetical protein
MQDSKRIGNPNGLGSSVTDRIPVADGSYLHDTNKRCMTVATGNLLIGAAAPAVDNAAGSTTGRVRLNGVARANEA